MSWAAEPETTRQGDIAYCLLGIFGLNMPMLYGEGRRAFRRLQEDIVRIAPDQTLFAWDFPTSTGSTNSCQKHSATVPTKSSITDQVPIIANSIFASHPRRFRRGSDMSPDAPSQYQSPVDPWMQVGKHYTITNCGLEIELSVLSSCARSSYVFSQLECYEQQVDEERGANDATTDKRKGVVDDHYREAQAQWIALIYKNPGRGGKPTWQRAYVPPGPFKIRRTHWDSKPDAKEGVVRVSVEMGQSCRTRSVYLETRERAADLRAPDVIDLCEDFTFWVLSPHSISAVKPTSCFPSSAWEVASVAGTVKLDARCDDMVGGFLGFNEGMEGVGIEPFGVFVSRKQATIDGGKIPPWYLSEKREALEEVGTA